MDMQEIWKPGEAVVRNARITRYMAWLEQERGRVFDDYAALWQWSVDDLEGFWSSIRDYFGIAFDAPGTAVLGARRMPGAEWFPGARLNYVDQVFRHAHETAPAIVFRDERGGLAETDWRELRRQVASLADALRRYSIGEGDRVVAYMPNVPETVVAFLAVAALGAVWSVCSPTWAWLPPRSVPSRPRSRSRRPRPRSAPRPLPPPPLPPLNRPPSNWP